MQFGTKEPIAFYFKFYRVNHQPIDHTTSFMYEYDKMRNIDLAKANLCNNSEPRSIYILGHRQNSASMLKSAQ